MDSQRTNKKIMGSLPGNQEFLRTLDARARMAEAAGGWSQTEPVEPVNSLDAVPESGGEGAGIRQAGVFGNPFDLGPGIDGTEAVAPDASSADRGGSGGPSYTWAGADALSGKLVDPVGDGRQPRGAWGLRPFRSLGYPGGLPDPRLHLGQDSPSGRSQFSLPAPEQPMRPAAGSPSALEGADGFVLGSSVSGPQELCGQRSRLDAAMRRRAIRWDMK
jgi:hypothetical protein